MVIVEISLTKGYSTSVDEVDADLIQFKWRCDVADDRTHVNYAVRSSSSQERRNGEKSDIYLHRIVLSRILNRPLLSAERVDHIDLNGLNNTRSNLRLATSADNGRNRPLFRNNTSGYKGVRRVKDSQRWQARIRVNYKEINLGSFNTAALAYEAYCKAATEFFGEFARTR